MGGPVPAANHDTDGHACSTRDSDMEGNGHAGEIGRSQLAPVRVSEAAPDDVTVRVRVREATPDDVAAMVELLAELFMIESDFDPDGSKQEAGLRMLLDSPKDRVLVADSGGQVRTCPQTLYKKYDYSGKKLLDIVIIIYYYYYWHVVVIILIIMFKINSRWQQAGNCFADVVVQPKGWWACGRQWGAGPNMAANPLNKKN